MYDFLVLPLKSDDKAKMAILVKSNFNHFRKRPYEENILFSKHSWFISKYVKVKFLGSHTIYVYVEQKYPKIKNCLSEITKFCMKISWYNPYTLLLQNKHIDITLNKLLCSIKIGNLKLLILKPEVLIKLNNFYHKNILISYEISFFVPLRLLTWNKWFLNGVTQINGCQKHM